MSNLTDEAVHDAKQGAKAVSSTVHAVKQGVKDAKVIGKAAGQAAAGNFAGAAATMVSHPETLSRRLSSLHSYQYFYCFSDLCFLLRFRERLQKRQ